jgi:uncharacterized protein (TIGR03083 family)
VVDFEVAPQLVAAVRARTDEVVAALRELGPQAIESASSLPGWTRLTIACHLRYGALASLRMTGDALAGRPTSFFPGGRTGQRPETLVPGPSEEPADVVRGLDRAAVQLHAAWERLSADQWAVTVREPDDNPDLGPVTLAMLALLRLTEVEVHGSDLSLGLSPWSPLFVACALPVRLAWLAARRSNRRAVDPSVGGSWRIVAREGPVWRVTVDGTAVTSELADPGAPADFEIEGESRDLLAMLLGRRLPSSTGPNGDRRSLDAFSRAFPGP